MTELQADAALIARMHLPVRFDTLGTPAAKCIAFARFDFDDVGSEIRKMLCQQVAGNQPGKVDDAKSRQRAADAGRVVSPRQSAFGSGSVSGICHESVL